MPLLQRINDSLKTSPRPVWLVYHNPVLRQSIEVRGDFQLMHDFSHGGSQFLIYVHTGVGDGPADT
ncbi:MAG: hypothetical protein ABGZ17_15220 [Planctomycetaceae bacterium]